MLQKPQRLFQLPLTSAGCWSGQLVNHSAKTVHHRLANSRQNDHDLWLLLVSWHNKNQAKIFVGVNRIQNMLYWKMFCCGHITIDWTVQALFHGFDSPWEKRELKTQIIYLLGMTKKNSYKAPRIFVRKLYHNIWSVEHTWQCLFYRFFFLLDPQTKYFVFEKQID